MHTLCSSVWLFGAFTGTTSDVTQLFFAADVMMCAAPSSSTEAFDD